MPELARSFTVIAVDQRGIGLSEKRRDGYDSATLANELVALMGALGHDRFAVVGQLASLPLGSSAGGFTYAFDDALGTFVRTSRILGPSCAERTSRAAS